MIMLSDIVNEILLEQGYEYVVRGRKKIRRKKRKPGFKVVGGKYVKMTSSEKIKRKKGARKGAKKRKAKKGIINKKRKLSLKKRKSLGLKRR